MTSNKVQISDVMNSKDTELRNKLYSKYVNDMTPKHNPVTNMFRSFLVGGLVCLLGQGLMGLFKYFSIAEDTAALYTTLSLIFLSVVLTGAGVFARLAKYAGAGVLVPITGFANSVASPAIEFKKEGQVFGIGCKIFTIAGPVILYGICTSWVLGLVYWIGHSLGWFR